MLEIINQKYMKFLFEIENKPRNLSQLAKDGDFTISIASTLISRWASKNIVIKKKLDGKGKDIVIYLTEYGKKQVALLRQLEINYTTNKEKINEMLNRINGGEK